MDLLLSHDSERATSELKVDVINTNVKDGEEASKGSAFQLDINRKQSGGYTEIKPLCAGWDHRTFWSTSLNWPGNFFKN